MKTHSCLHERSLTYGMTPFRHLVKSAQQKRNFFLFLKQNIGYRCSKITENICFKLWVREYLKIFAEKFCLA